MDKNQLASKLNKSLPGMILETRRFGRSQITSIWVEAKQLLKVAEILKSDAELGFDWLENLSVVEFEKVLVVTYFIRSIASHESLVIRTSAVPLSNRDEVVFPSVRSVWPMSEPMEREASEMFGAQFKLEEGEEAKIGKILPEGWVGFPLRKKYVFPTEFFGIEHSRPFDRLKERKPLS